MSDGVDAQRAALRSIIRDAKRSRFVKDDASRSFRVKVGIEPESAESDPDEDEKGDEEAED